MMRIISNIFKALSDETRLKMLGLLYYTEELCVCDFVEVLQITQSKASRHLRYLVNAGLIVDRREAVWVYFRISKSAGNEAAQVLNMLPEIVQVKISAELLERLRSWKKNKTNLWTCKSMLGDTV